MFQEEEAELAEFERLRESAKNIKLFEKMPVVPEEEHEGLDSSRTPQSKGSERSVKGKPFGQVPAQPLSTRTTQPAPQTSIPPSRSPTSPQSHPTPLVLPSFSELLGNLPPVQEVADLVTMNQGLRENLDEKLELLREYVQRIQVLEETIRSKDVQLQNALKKLDEKERVEHQKTVNEVQERIEKAERRMEERNELTRLQNEAVMEKLDQTMAFVREYIEMTNENRNQLYSTLEKVDVYFHTIQQNESNSKRNDLNELIDSISRRMNRTNIYDYSAAHVPRARTEQLYSPAYDTPTSKLLLPLRTPQDTPVSHLTSQQPRSLAQTMNANRSSQAISSSIYQPDGHVINGGRHPPTPVLARPITFGESLSNRANFVVTTSEPSPVDDIPDNISYTSKSSRRDIFKRNRGGSGSVAGDKKEASNWKGNSQADLADNEGSVLGDGQSSIMDEGLEIRSFMEGDVLTDRKIGTSKALLKKGVTKAKAQVRTGFPEG
jgi:hypothetical protein